MSGIRIQIGGVSFREIRETSCYYADKTGFLEEFLSTAARVRRAPSTLVRKVY